MSLRLGTLLALGALPIFARAQAPATQPAHDESAWLRNIRQLTRPEMGLDRAGEAYFAPDGRRISFQAYPRGQRQYQIYVMNLDGGDLKMISNGQGACTCSFFHPSGEKLIFASNFADLREMPAPDSAPTSAPASAPAARPAPAPASQSASAPAQRPGRGYAWQYYPGMDIYEYTFATGALRNLTHTDGYDAEGGYAPDGRHIVFSSFRDGAQKIYVMDADGNAVKCISTGPGDGGAFFSPDGQRVIYRGDRTGDGNMQIFTNNLAGTDEQALTHADGASHWCPYYHPSGRWIAYTLIQRGRFDVYVMRTDGTDVRRVTSAGEWNGLPVFSNDGRKLMWTAKRDGVDPPQIFIADFIGLTPAGELAAAREPAR